MKNPDIVRPRITQECVKLDTGLQDMHYLDAGIILFNEHKSDTGVTAISVLGH